MVSYTPQFNPPPWTDFVDTVQAGGSNGFNARFQAIVTEFNALQQVVSQINTALQAPPPALQTLTLTPALTSTGAPPWQQNVAFVSVPTATIGGTEQFAATAQGFMPLNLPDAATLQSLRVTGSSAGGFLQVIVNQQPLTGGATTGILQASQLFPTAAAAAAFDIPAVPQNVNFVIDNKNYKYFILVSFSEGNTTLAAGGTNVNAFQISYSAS
jgi:hypothetical protein